jgi:hypothetical protein
MHSSVGGVPLDKSLPASHLDAASPPHKKLQTANKSACVAVCSARHSGTCMTRQLTHASVQIAAAMTAAAMVAVPRAMGRRLVWMMVPTPLMSPRPLSARR